MAVKKKTIQKTSSFSFMAVAFSLMFISSFYISKSFTDFFIVPKHFFTVFAGLVPISFVLVYFFFTKAEKRYSLNGIDLSLLIYFLYVTLQQIFMGINLFESLRYLDLLYVVVIYFLFKPLFSKDTKLNENEKFTRTVLIILILIGLIQAIYGVLQYAGKIESLQKEFLTGGAFGNPGPYSNYITALIPVSLAFFILEKKGITRTLAIISFLAMLLVLPFTSARTAWISAMFSIVYVLMHHNKIVGWRKKYLSSAKNRIILGLSIFILTVAAIWFLKGFKQESASGRLFIWKVSSYMVADKPIAGSGFGSYTVVHNNFQSDYFRNNPNDTENAFLADGINYAFNEYLQIACETGIIGLLLFLSIFFFILLRKKLDNQPNNTYTVASEGIILSILISSFFSYPIQSLPVLLVMITAICILSTRITASTSTVRSAANPIISIPPNNLLKRTTIILLVILIGFFLSMEIQRFKAEKKWLFAFRYVREQKYDLARQVYAELYPVMKYSPFFLFNYGAELSVMGDYDKSIEILKETGSHLNDSDYWIYFGNSYEGAGNYDKAITCYKQASYIMPVKFYPKYRLVLLYDKMGNTTQALRFAHQILEMKMKVKTDIAENINREMQNYINQHP